MVQWFNVTFLPGPTMKIEQSAVMEKYADEIETLYAQSIE